MVEAEIVTVTHGHGPVTSIVRPGQVRILPRTPRVDRLLRTGQLVEVSSTTQKTAKSKTAKPKKTVPPVETVEVEDGAVEADNVADEESLESDADSVSVDENP